MSKKMEQLYDVFRSKGYNPVNGTIYQQQEKWVSWYRGTVNDFHFFQVKSINGRKYDRQKKSLHMAKKIGEDWAGLLFNEKTVINVNNDKAQQRLNEVLRSNNFTDDASDWIEKVIGAYGTGCLIEYVSNGNIEIDYAMGKIIPISYSNGRIDSIAVLQEFQEGKVYYTHITYHIFEDGVYTIEHELWGAPQKAYLGTPQKLHVLFNEKELADLKHTEEDEFGNEIVRYYTQYETKKAFFQPFKPAISNNFDLTSPMGVTVTANSISTLENIDEAYYNLYLEGITSRRRIMINSEATKIQKVKTPDGNIEYVSYFDIDDPLLQSVPMGAETPFKEFSPENRSQGHIETIKFELNLLSSKSGLGNNYYSYDSQKGVTATEIISRNSDTWKNREKHIKRLEEVLQNMAYAILKLESSINPVFGVDVDSLEITVEFDDSIIKDDEQELTDMKADAESGFVPMWRYVAKKYKLSEDDAKKWVQEAKGEDDLSAFMGIGERDEIET